MKADFENYFYLKDLLLFLTKELFWSCLFIQYAWKDAKQVLYLQGGAWPEQVLVVLPGDSNLFNMHMYAGSVFVLLQMNMPLMKSTLLKNLYWCDFFLFQIILTTVWTCYMIHEDFCSLLFVHLLLSVILWAFSRTECLPNLFMTLNSYDIRWFYCVG